MSEEAAYKKVFGRPESLKDQPTPTTAPDAATPLPTGWWRSVSMKWAFGKSPSVFLRWDARCWLTTTSISTWSRRPMAGPSQWQQASSESDRIDFVISYQGDGDLAAIGTAETIHAANRGEEICTIFINNAIYGMTGGQMAPTTILGQEATTAPGRPGREASRPAHRHLPDARSLRRSRLHRTLLSRFPEAHPPGQEGDPQVLSSASWITSGFLWSNLLSPCPTNWKLSPKEAWAWVNEVMVKTYPIGVIKDTTRI